MQGAFVGDVGVVGLAAAGDAAFGAVGLDDQLGFDGGAAREASCCYRRMLAKHGGDLLPAVDPAQLNFATGHEAEEQDQRRVFAQQTWCA